MSRKRRTIKEINDDIYQDMKSKREPRAASNNQIENMKRFWEETSEKPAFRELNASLLRSDFLSLIFRIYQLEEQVERLNLSLQRHYTSGE